MLNLKDNADARFWYHNISAFLLAWLLGTAVGAELKPYLWILLARPLAAIGVTLLPPTTAGEARPYLVGSGLLCLGLVNLLAPDGLPLAVSLALLCLFADTAVDGVMAASCPEKERLGRLGQGILARGSGLGLGLLCAPLLAKWPELSRSPLSYPLLVLVLLWALLPERPDRAAWKPSRDGHEVRTATVMDSLEVLRERPMATALLVLLAVSALSGTYGVTLSPLAILSPDLLSQWLAYPLHWLGGAAACAMMALTLERASNRSLLAFSFSLLLVCAGVMGSGRGGPYLTPVLWMVAGLAMMVACRRLIAVPLRSPYLQATVPITVWALGVLAGQTPTSRDGVLWLRLASAVVVATATVWTLRNWGAASRLIFHRVTETERRIHDRHGDRKLDFEAAPQMMEGRSRTRWLSRIWFFLTIRFPVTFAMVVLASFVLAGGWHVADQRKEWEKRTQSMWKSMQTQLFLTSLKRRLEEEMLASNRVPTDWNQFVSNNFELDGRPLKNRDFWGTALLFDSQAGKVRIASAGPDRKHGTPDDLQRFASKPDGVR